MEMHGMTGERLGSIGGGGDNSGGSQSRKGSSTTGTGTRMLPQWKHDLLAAPSISVRRGVARAYGVAYEDTSTLVLTSSTGPGPGRWFIDIRFALGEDPTGGASYWAFAGSSEVTFPSDGRKGDRRRGAGGGWREGGEVVEIPCMAHCVWKHEIDSKGAGEADEGDLYLLGNGQVVEVGVSGAGPSGKVEMYKEYWEGLEVEEGAKCVVARTAGGEVGEGGGNGVGMVVRIGRHCQAILQNKSVSAKEAGRAGEVHVERWYRSRETGVWTRDQRSTTNTGDTSTGGEDVVMPSKWVCEEGRKLGDVVELLGRKWEVVECS